LQNYEQPRNALSFPLRLTIFFFAPLRERQFSQRRKVKAKGAKVRGESDLLVALNGKKILEAGTPLHTVVSRLRRWV
jgi:hypothetical protein